MKLKIMNEKLIEKKLKKAVEKSGGLAIKIASAWFTGMPDRLILMPGGKAFWVETKSTGKTMRGRQKIVRKQLEALGFEVSMIDDETSLANFLNRYVK
jgi:hypothetical protein